MDTLSYSAFRANLASTFDKVNDDHKPVLIGCIDWLRRLSNV